MKRRIVATGLATALTLGMVGFGWNVRSAENASPLVGTWRVTSFSAEFLDTHETSHIFGEHPTGYLQYSPGAHIVAFEQSAEMPKPASATWSDADRAAIHRSIIAAYAGTYSVEGNKVTYHIVAAWRPDWIGGDQVRYFQINGNVMTLKTAPIVDTTNGRQRVSTITLERVE